MDYFGLLNICKLPGMSSHEVVNVVRRIAGMKRVGHSGTLDPSACGVLLVCLGKAARLSDYISAGCKSYRADILFGIITDGGDAEGRVLAQQDAGHLREAEVVAAIRPFTGTFLQRPPARSAVWIHGERAYAMVLRGETVEMPLREVTVSAFTPVRFVAGTHPRLLVGYLLLARHLYPQPGARSRRGAGGRRHLEFPGAHQRERMPARGRGDPG